ncbi:hypothetical protein [Clostridium gasigenes]|nr:hypothetical protein [Clostridium gasigenes]
MKFSFIRIIEKNAVDITPTEDSNKIILLSKYPTQGIECIAL